MAIIRTVSSSREHKTIRIRSSSVLRCHENTLLRTTTPVSKSRAPGALLSEASSSSKWVCLYPLFDICENTTSIQLNRDKFYFSWLWLRTNLYNIIIAEYLTTGTLWKSTWSARNKMFSESNFLSTYSINYTWFYVSYLKFNIFSPQRLFLSLFLKHLHYIYCNTTSAVFHSLVGCSNFNYR